VHAFSVIFRFLVKLAVLAMIGAVIAAVLGVVRSSKSTAATPVTLDQWPSVPEKRAS